MRKQSLAKSGTTAFQERQQAGLINLAEQVRYGKQSSLNSVIIIRFLAIFFCLAFWYGVYILVKLFIS
jgi:hypothetical protein